MALFSISDLHLSFGADKPMDTFGGAWVNYLEKIRVNWLENIREGDHVVLPGDLSWGMSLNDALPDFRFLDSLPGIKYILKGNHDYFWDTAAKMVRFFEENGISTIKIIHNNHYIAGSSALCGTKGWFYESEFSNPHDEKIFKRETIRLRASLESAKKAGASRIFTFLHYPPIYQGRESVEIVALLKEFGVSACFFGHLHGASHGYAFQGAREGIEYRLVAADFLGFKAYFICDC
jgi:predicted phosphohydrolase